MVDVIAGEDALVRCAWGASPPEYRAYHDNEWGRPTASDDRIYEKLCLEGFQAGLSWLTILRRREGFRQAFAGFDPAEVASFGPEDVDRLLADTRIIRHRGKIQAAIANARATVALREQGISLAGLVWRYQPVTPSAPSDRRDIPSVTGESTALSQELRRHGFAFVGPTTVYAALQSLGIVNDHLVNCHWRAVCEEERRRFIIPNREQHRADNR